ncbi:MAG: nuclear transport factor 2 family protein [Pseudomonadota bacterium]
MTVPEASLAALNEAAHVSAITQLVLAERECRDMGRWERMKSCYHSDGFVRISWFQGNAHDFVDASQEMAVRGVPAKHRLGPVAVRVAGTRAVATMVITIDIPAVIKGVALIVSNQARVFYRAELRDDAWKLFSFEVLYMRDELSAQMPGDVLPVKASDLAGYRSSYRCLSYLLDSGGYKVRDDLAGEDRPETVEALCAEIYGWAGLPR